MTGKCSDGIISAPELLKHSDIIFLGSTLQERYEKTCIGYHMRKCIGQRNVVSAQKVGFCGNFWKNHFLFLCYSMPFASFFQVEGEIS